MMVRSSPRVPYLVENTYFGEELRRLSGRSGNDAPRSLRYHPRLENSMRRMERVGKTALRLAPKQRLDKTFQAGGTIRTPKGLGGQSAVSYYGITWTAKRHFSAGTSAIIPQVSVMLAFTDVSPDCPSLFPADPRKRKRARIPGSIPPVNA